MSSRYTVQIHPNGFVSVWMDDRTFTVQGMQNERRRIRSGASFDANASRPSCTCEHGHDKEWCAHKRAVYDRLSADAQ